MGSQNCTNLKPDMGDIKPENFLIFTRDSNEQELLAPGILVLADVGIAKFHNEQTFTRRQNGDPTINKSGTRRYEPPEMERQEGQIRILSRKVDTWSMGCVPLELVIWLLRGNQGQNRFNQDLLEKEPQIDRFWHLNRLKCPRPHPVVKRWIKELLRSVGKPSALKDLLVLVEERLLVGPEKSRADCEQTRFELLKIEQKCLVDPSYLWDHTSTTLIGRRGTMTDSELPSENVYRISQQVGVRGSRKPLEFD